ncbi:MAG: hypothetical protein KIT73_12905 [Burkholderiales bacterium]|nr:hypothetical protein [Burkholderiales bacterium]
MRFGRSAAALMASLLVGCSTPLMQAYELEKQGDYVGAAKIHEAEAERYRTENVILPVDAQLASALRLYENKVKDLVKAREVAQRRVVWWGTHGGGGILVTSSGEQYDSLGDTARAQADLARICGKTGDAACLTSAGDKVLSLFSSRAIPDYLRGDSYGNTLDDLAESYAAAGMADRSLKARVLSLSTGRGLQAVYYHQAIEQARRAGKQALVSELEHRQSLLERTPRVPGEAYPSPDFENPRNDARSFAGWADRLEQAGAPALAAIARVESVALEKSADEREARLQAHLASEQSREAERQKTDASMKEIERALRALQAMQNMP